LPELALVWRTGQLKVTETRPLSVLVFLGHQPLPGVFFRGPLVSGAERAVGIFKNESDGVTVTRGVATKVSDDAPRGWAAIEIMRFASKDATRLVLVYQFEGL
jgi:hypothetical protein